MKLASAFLTVVFALAAQGANAQNLSPQQAHGRQILTQNCNVCHLPQNPGSATYGPRLSKTTTNGDDKLMHDVIMNGLVRMPAWKYTLKEQDVSDIISYVRTLPEPPPPTAGRGGGGAE